LCIARKALQLALSEYRRAHVSEVSSLEAILATDVGSTTTKAILLERHTSGWRLAAREEAPTTVEAPHEDVTVGVRQAIARLERVTGRRILGAGEVVAPRRDGCGVDLYISTSSAGGGLQMVAAGLIRAYSAGSAERAALGAGAIVSRTLTINDAQLAAEAIDVIRRLRPDIVLLCGGIDHGNVAGIVSLAEYLAVADPQPRLGSGRLPVVFAGNPGARSEVDKLLGERFALYYADNVRPELATERLEPARGEVHRVFLNHVMSRAPGYDKLLNWSSRRLEPTPHAVGTMMRILARSRGRDLLGLDLGGATTDVFTVRGGRFERSVSANLGLSYSAGNVLQHAGLDAIRRWLPVRVSEEDVLDSIYNKMIRPTTLPETLIELALEHAMAREAIRLAVQHHQGIFPQPGRAGLAHGLRDLLNMAPPEPQLDVGMIIGSGGPLCHAPRRLQAALILLDAAAGPGATDLFVDSVFMLPHLGVLATTHPDIAQEVLERDCLVPLGTAFVARLPTLARPGQVLGQARLVPQGAGVGGDAPQVQEQTLRAGQILRMDLPMGSTARVEIFPQGRVDFGRGPGRLMARNVDGGTVGVLFDMRGRPHRFARGEDGRVSQVQAWLRSVGAYPGLDGDAGELGRGWGGAVSAGA